MIISKNWLSEKNACTDGENWFLSQKETDGKKVVEKLISENKLQWANWLIVRIMNRKQYLSYAIFAAEQVIDIFEKKYPNDKRPRMAIEAAKKVLENDTAENRVAAYAAADDAAAYADAAAAYAADAATAAAYAAAADAAAYATAAADAAAAYAAAAAIRLKILNYGLSILE